jgi:hypothetical protein
MRIYLDSCVYQDIKRKADDELLTLILHAKKNNIYCFSEAHIYDLVRDKSDKKLKDMELIERVAERNCYYYDKKIQFAYYSPTEYYKRFDWTPTEKAFENESTNSLFTFLKFIPLNFKLHIKSDQIPPDCPKDFIPLLEKSTTMYDFCINFLDFTEDLTEDQKKFKEFVKYLHKNALTGKIYEGLGIKGFDGTEVVDRQIFKDSYLNYHANQSVDKHMNWVFANMYNGLEMLGIVKGKPRKQRMMNMINDGKHAYFGAFCDVVVSNDEDFIKKTKFLYDTFDIKTDVLSADEFVKAQENFVLKSNITDCIEAIKHVDLDKMEKTSNEEGDYYISILQPRHFGYFNRLVFAPREKLDNFYFLRQSENWSTGTLGKEIEYVTNLLVEQLGDDSDKKGAFDGNEFVGEDWKGRTWLLPGTFIELKYRDGLSLRFGLVHDVQEDITEPQNE